MAVAGRGLRKSVGDGREAMRTGLVETGGVGDSGNILLFTIGVVLGELESVVLAKQCK